MYFLCTRRNRAVTTKKCTKKKRDARAKLLVIKPVAFLAFSLLSSSSDLKANICLGGPVVVTLLPVPLSVFSTYERRISFISRRYS